MKRKLLSYSKKQKGQPLSKLPFRILFDTVLSGNHFLFLNTSFLTS
jgi:hypothetical protein